MKRLNREKQAQIISALIEGCSIRATSRMLGVSKDTVLKLQVEAGYLAADHQDKNLRGLSCKRVQVDEVWAFCFAKQKNVSEELEAKQFAGDVWTWTAIDAENETHGRFHGWQSRHEDLTYPYARLGWTAHESDSANQ